ERRPPAARAFAEAAPPSRVARAANSPLQMEAVTKAKTTVNATELQSIETTSARGNVPACSVERAASPHHASPTPSAPPAAQSSSASPKNCAASRHDPAPSARR